MLEYHLFLSVCIRTLKMLEGKRIAHQELQLLNFKTLDISRYTLRVTEKVSFETREIGNVTGVDLLQIASKTPNET